MDGAPLPPLDGSKVVRKNGSIVFLSRFYAKHDRFTKTGLGQTQGKLLKPVVFRRQAQVDGPHPWLADYGGNPSNFLECIPTCAKTPSLFECFPYVVPSLSW
jgi:hypothetical protein